MWSKEKWKEYRRAYYLKNRDKALAYSKLHPKVRDEKRKLYEREWKRKHPDRIKQWKLNYFNKHGVLPDTSPSRQARHARRRTLERNCEGSFTPKEWRALLESTGNKCQDCGRQPPEIKLTVDHIVPLVLGGTNYITNIQSLCLSCNSRKGITLRGTLKIKYATTRFSKQSPLLHRRYWCRSDEEK